jgi:hypothetical protein
MREDEAHHENNNAYAKRAATNSEKLIEVALEIVRHMGKISAEGFAQIARRPRLIIAVGEMNYNSNWLIDG